MRFLIDAQLPPALARHLVTLGHEANHVVDVGLLTARDHEIWRYAEANDAVNFSCNGDLCRAKMNDTIGHPPND